MLTLPTSGFFSSSASASSPSSSPLSFAPMDLGIPFPVLELVGRKGKDGCMGWINVT